MTQPVSVINAVKRALQHEGFSFLESLSPCPTQFGRRNRLDRPEDLVRDLMERCVLEEETEGMSEEELAEKIITGELLPCQG